MTSLQHALKYLKPELHPALRQCAAMALPLCLSRRPFALQTRPGVLRTDAAKNDEAGHSNRKRTSPYKSNLPLWSSKCGGFGYLPKGEPYPVRPDTGSPLQLVAQINFSELNAALGEEAYSCVLPSPLWPRRGILAFYMDPFDDLYGCPFRPPMEQIGFRVLYFENAMEEVVRPILDEVKAGGLTEADAEARVAALMWSREEQYNVFERFHTAHPDKTATFMRHGGGSTETPEGKEEEERHRQELWKLPADLDPEVAPKVKEHEACTLWWAQVVHREYALLPDLGDAGETHDHSSLLMTPMDSIELAQRVVAAAARGNPPFVLRDDDDVPQTLEDIESGACVDYSSLLRSGGGEGGDAEEAEDVEEAARDVDFRLSPIWLGGYPEFTQTDPREVYYGDEGIGATRREEDRGADGLVHADMLLLQLGETSEKMMWGDMGTAQLFISERNLLERRFDRAWFNWDCC